MGNSFGCSASGERLVPTARDGDLLEAKMLLELNPCLAKYSTFCGLNSPLHFAAAKGHNEIVTLLLENGADVNSRNYCGQVCLVLNQTKYEWTTDNHGPRLFLPSTSPPSAKRLPPISVCA